MKSPRKPLAIAMSALAYMGFSQVCAAQGPVPPTPWESAVHIFSIDDLQTDWDGRTYGPGGAEADPDAICGLPGGVSCPTTVDAAGNLLVKPYTDKEGVPLYPVDTALGFYVVDFLGAQEKTTAGDRDYGEGYVGNITSGGDVIGVKVSNSATAKYRVKPPMGTWCQGLGGTSVKCSTEHFTVMEHALSCHESIPYMLANPETGLQAMLSFPDGTGQFDCSTAELDNVLYILENGQPGGPLTSVEPGEELDANDNTTVLDDIAVSADYSITLKDDGKPLYRWGGLVKRPNDIRFYAKIELPAEWKVPGADYPITSAKLVVSHWITNNPNDQLRPEDLENEGATGRTPSYKVDGDDWVSLRKCYEGDGDFIDSEEGGGAPDPIGAGTVLKNGGFAGAPVGSAPPAPGVFSSDLSGGFTNAFYTTINRDPFEWSYVDVDDEANDVFDFNSGMVEPQLVPLSATEMENANLRLVSGPRWRLRSNKFGQDIPGLEVPLVECSAPPFSHSNIRYEVGEPAVTEINLLDWDESEGTSPLATSRGWVDVAANEFVETHIGANGQIVTSNGLPMTDDFDLAVYIKGDRKETALYSAQLVLEYGDALPPVDCDLFPEDPACVEPPVDCDLFPEDPSCVEPPAAELDIAAVSMPTSVRTYTRNELSADILNTAEAGMQDGSVEFSNDQGFSIELAFSSLGAGDSITLSTYWRASGVSTVNWTIVLKASDGTVVEEQTAVTQVTGWVPW